MCGQFKALPDTPFLLLLCVSIAGVFTFLLWRFLSLSRLFGKDFVI